MDSVFELADSFLSEILGMDPDEKRTLAAELVEKVTQASVQIPPPPPPPPPARRGRGVPEPKAFSFSFQETDDSTMTSPSGAASKTSSNRRAPPKPEESQETDDSIMTNPTGTASKTSSNRRAPPRPEEARVASRGRSNTRRRVSASGNSPRSASPIIRNPSRADAVELLREASNFSQVVDGHQLPPKNSPPRRHGAPLPPRNSPGHSPGHSPRKSNIVVVGGPQDDHNDNDDCSLGGASRASTVATQTLDTILGRIEMAKTILMDPRTDGKKQMETANLIERLASAACAMKKLESLAL